MPTKICLESLQALIEKLLQEELDKVEVCFKTNEDFEKYKLDRKEAIKQQLVGNKSSIRSNLKSINFDVDNFKDTNKRYSLYYVLYTLQGKYETNIFNIMSNRTLENVDNNPLFDTEHGEFIRNFKNQLKELMSSNFAKDSKEDISDIINNWDHLNLDIFRSMENSSKGKTIELQCKLEDFNDVLTDICGKLSKVKLNMFKKEEDIIKGMYLNVITMENISKLEDSNKIYELLNQSEYTKCITDRKHKDYEEYKLKYKLDNLVITNVGEYIKSNIDYICKLVYQRENIEESKKNIILNSIGVVKKIFDYYISFSLCGYLDLYLSTDTSFKLLHLVSILREIVIEEDKEFKEYAGSVIYKFYKGKSRTVTISSIIKKMESGDSEKEFYKLILVNKVERSRIYYLGAPELYTLKNRIAENINKIIIHILSVPSMKSLNILDSLIKDKLCSKYLHTLVLERFNNDLRRETGFSTIVINNFKLPVEFIYAYDEVLENFKKAIKYYGENGVYLSNYKLSFEYKFKCIYADFNFENKLIIFKLKSYDDMEVLSALKLEGLIQ